MKYIKEMVDHIDEEIEGAKEYAEKYVEYKARNNMQKANKYKEMAQDELRHAMILHEWAVEEINELSSVYTAPAAMLEAWEKSHREYVERVAWIKQMLTM